MRKIAFALVGLLVVLVAAILIGPSFIDWNAYKGRIVAAVQDAIGRATAIDGDVSFVVLPAPELRVAGLRIANFDGARSPDMLRLKELRLRLSVAALLEGRIAVEELELIEPILALETGADGTASWDIESAAASDSAPESDDSDDGEAGTIDISLAGVTIQNGSVSYRAAGAPTARTVERLNMAISAPSLAGPFNVTAEARYRGTPFSVALKTSVVKPGQPIGITLKLALIDAAASVEFVGRLTAPGPDALLSGTVKLSGDSAARLASLGTDAAPPAVLRQAITLEGTVMASGQAVSLNDTRFQLGDTTGNGAVSITLGDVIGADIAVSINRLDLDALLAQTGALEVKSSGAAAPDATPRAAAPKTAFSLPTDINISLDLAVEAIQYRGGVIRQAGLRGSLANGAVTLDRASALLPGGSDVSLVGFLQAVDGEPLFEGEIAAASDNLRAMLRWLGVDTRALPADRLRGFSFSSTLTATPSAVQIPDINLRLDATTATGGLAVALRERLGFGLRLEIDRLNLDAYLPKPSKKKRPGDASQAAGSAAVQKPPPRAFLAFLDDFDANIEARVGRLTIRKAVARKVAFSGQLVGGVLSIRKFSVADVAGARIDITGTVRGFAATPSAAADFDIAIGEPAQLFRFLDTPLPIPKEKLVNLTVSGRVSGTASAFKLTADIAGAGGTVRFDGAVDLGGAAPSIDAEMAINFPELVDFIRLAAPEFNPAAAKLGAVKATFKINGGPSKLRISALDMNAGPVAVTGEIAWRTDGPRPAISATLATSEVLLDLFRPASRTTGAATARARLRANGSSANGARAERWSRAPIDFSALRAFDADVRLSMSGLISDRIQLAKPEVTAVLTAGRLEVKQFRAGLFGGAVSGNAILDTAGPTPALSANLSVRNIDMAAAAKTFGGDARVAGRLTIDASLTSSGNSQAALIAALGGQGSIGGKARILATKQEKRAIDTLGIAAALFGGKFKELRQVGGVSSVLLKAFGDAPATLSGNFTIQRGIVRTGDATLSGAGARAVSAGTVDLPRWLIDMTTSVYRSGDTARTPYVGLRLTGAVDAPNVKASGAFLGGGTAAAPSNPLQQLLPGLLGAKNDAPRKKTRPEDLLRGFLKGLGK